MKEYILRCQDVDDGGIADRPGDMPDVFHTFFGLAGLSLLVRPAHIISMLPWVTTCNVRAQGDSRLAPIDPVYALPVDTLRRLGIPSIYSELELPEDAKVNGSESSCRSEDLQQGEETPRQ